MNRHLYYKYLGLKDSTEDYYILVRKELEDRKSLDSFVDSIIELIFSPDEFTRLPNGDISMYLASSTRPEVKQFILDNLQVDLRGREIDVVPSSLKDVVSDDDIMYLTRSSDESRESYLSRVYSYIQSNSKSSSEGGSADIQKDGR